MTLTAPALRESKERLDHLRPASLRHAESVLDGDNFHLVADRLRKSVPGFSHQEYRDALERGLAGAREEREKNLRAREALIEEIKSMSLLDAVFELRDYTSRPIPADRLGPISVSRALQGLYGQQEIRDAVSLTNRLLKAGRRCDLSDTDAPARLKLRFPGFSDDKYFRAANHGWWLTR